MPALTDNWANPSFHPTSNPIKKRAGRSISKRGSHGVPGVVPAVKDKSWVRKVKGGGCTGRQYWVLPGQLVRCLSLLSWIRPHQWMVHILLGSLSLTGVCCLYGMNRGVSAVTLGQPSWWHSQNTTGKQPWTQLLSDFTARQHSAIYYVYFAYKTALWVGYVS